MLGEAASHFHALHVNRARSVQMAELVRVAVVFPLFPWILLFVTSSVSVC